MGDALSWSPDGESIAFGAFNASRQGEIAAVNVADGSLRRIGSQDWPEVLNLTWLPDGSSLMVVSIENVGERRRQIWLVTYPDGEARRITNDLNIFVQPELTLSADGALVNRRVTYRGALIDNFKCAQQACEACKKAPLHLTS